MIKQYQKSYLIVLLVGVISGGVLITAFTKVIPEMMSKMMAGMMQNMMMQMKETGCNPTDI